MLYLYVGLAVCSAGCGPDVNSTRAPFEVAKAIGLQGPEAAHELRRWLRAGYDPNRSTGSSACDTPLGQAARWRRVEAVALLLQGGADPGLPDDQGWTPLMCAAQCDSSDEVCPDLIRQLVAAGADPAVADGQGRTALMRAAAVGHTGNIRALSASSRDLDARDSNGDSAVVLAAKGGHTESVQLLRSLGADMTGAPRYKDETSWARVPRVGRVLVGQSWDQALEHLGHRTKDIHRITDDLFVDYRAIDGEDCEVTFARPEAPATGVYRIRSIQKKVVKKVAMW